MGGFDVGGDFKAVGPADQNVTEQHINLAIWHLAETDCGFARGGRIGGMACFRQRFRNQFQSGGCLPDHIAIGFSQIEKTRVDFAGTGPLGDNTVNLNFSLLRAVPFPLQDPLALEISYRALFIRVVSDLPEARLSLTAQLPGRLCIEER